MKEPSYTCSAIDKGIKKVEQILDDLSEEISNLQLNELDQISDKCQDAYSEISDLFEDLRSQNEDLRSWGQSVGEEKQDEINDLKEEINDLSQEILELKS